MPKIVVYSKNNCAPCERVKTFLESYNIEFEERNIDMYPESRDDVIAMGFRSVPVIRVKSDVGSDQIASYNLYEIGKWLESHGVL